VLTLDFLGRQAREVAALANDLAAMLAEAIALEPLTAARLTLDLANVAQALEGIAERLDVATAPAEEPDGGQQS